MSRRYLDLSEGQFSKKSFGERWSGIVSAYEVGTRLSGVDLEFMTEVCRQIERFRKILDRGEPCFKVVNKHFNGKRVRGIVLVTPNSGYEVWIGKQYVMSRVFPRATLPDPVKQHRQLVLRALRKVVEPQIQMYRQRVSSEQTVVKSSLSGKPVMGPYHVDHVYPFIRLVEEWCRENRIDLERIEIVRRGASCRLKSTELAESWFDYHALHAKFQVLDASENTSKGSRY